MSLLIGVVWAVVARMGSDLTEAEFGNTPVSSPSQMTGESETTDENVASTASSSVAPAVVVSSTDMCDERPPCGGLDDTSTTVTSVAAAPTTEVKVVSGQTTTTLEGTAGESVLDTEESVQVVPPTAAPTEPPPSSKAARFDEAVKYLVANTPWPPPPSIPGFVLHSPEMTFQRVQFEVGVDDVTDDVAIVIGRYRYWVIEGYAGFDDPFGWCNDVRVALPGLLSETACEPREAWSPPVVSGLFNGELSTRFNYELDPTYYSRLQFTVSILLDDLP